jgi:hypothetical protein
MSDSGNGEHDPSKSPWRELTQEERFADWLSLSGQQPAEELKPPDPRHPKHHTIYAGWEAAPESTELLEGVSRRLADEERVRAEKNEAEMLLRRVLLPLIASLEKAPRKRLVTWFRALGAPPRERGKPGGAAEVSQA